LVVAALTKGGHFHWAIGGMISAYLLYLAVQYAKHGASRARALGVAHSIMMKHSESTVGLTTTATIAAATVPMSGAVVPRSHLEHFTQARAKPIMRNVTNADRNAACLKSRWTIDRVCRRQMAI
jgi:hypothetical protein